MEDINQVMKSLLLQNHFDHNRKPDDSKDSDSETSDSDSDDTISSNESSDDEQMVTQVKRTREKAEPKTILDHNETKVKASSQLEPNKQYDQKIESLIMQIGKLLVNNPSYSIHYFRAYQVDPIITDLVPKPMD